MGSGDDPLFVNDPWARAAPKARKVSTPPPSDDDEPRPAGASAWINERPAAKFPPAKTKIPNGPMPVVGPAGVWELPKKRWTFHVQLFKEHPNDKLGLRLEKFVDGAESCARVHKIAEEGLVNRWNDMAQVCGMPQWQIKIDDIIVGVNGRKGFHADEDPAQNEANLDLLIVRARP
eukprot:Skav208521  [mRNA]  locus=scaffold1322:227428:227955:- [translate_table: standard]